MYALKLNGKHTLQSKTEATAQRASIGKFEFIIDLRLPLLQWVFTVPNQSNSIYSKVYLCIQVNDSFIHFLLCKTCATIETRNHEVIHSISMATSNFCSKANQTHLIVSNYTHYFPSGLIGHANWQISQMLVEPKQNVKKVISLIRMQCKNHVSTLDYELLAFPHVLSTLHGTTLACNMPGSTKAGMEM